MPRKNLHGQSIKVTRAYDAVCKAVCDQWERGHKEAWREARRQARKEWREMIAFVRAKDPQMARKFLALLRTMGKAKK